MSRQEASQPNPDSLSAQVGRRLRDRRHELGSTLVQTASDAAVSPAHLGEIETGESYCSLPVLLRLSRALEYPMSELLPRIGGHRVHQGELGKSANTTEVLSHAQLDLDILGLQLEPGESYEGNLDRRQTMIFVVDGECEMSVGDKTVTLCAGDAADIVNAMKISISATTDVVGLLVRGRQ